MIEERRCYVIAEIGINHNGDIDIAKQLIGAAAEADCDAVKFQKRTVEVVYSSEELERYRESPFGNSNGDLKRGLEFGKKEYDVIDSCCQEAGIEWFASAWDEESVDFLMQYDIPYLKVASASVTDKSLIKHFASTGRPLLVSTGMCDLPMIRKAIDIIRDANGKIASLFHCTSTYPANMEELNLLGIHTLQKEFPDIPIGYSGHEVSPNTTVMAAVLGAASIERHVTLSRAMWGSDHGASLEIQAFKRMIRDIRTWETVRGDGVIRIYDSEREVEKKLRRVDTL